MSGRTGTAHVNVSALRPGWTITHLLPVGADPADDDAWHPIGIRTVRRAAVVLDGGTRAVELHSDGVVRVMVYPDRWQGARVVTATPGGRARATLVPAARRALGWSARGGNYYDRDGRYTGVKGHAGLIDRAQACGYVVLDLLSRRWHVPAGHVRNTPRI